MLGIWMAWFIPHLIANSLASVVVMLTVWWTVLMIVSEFEWICNINEVMLFLILVSVITAIVLESNRISLKFC